MLSPHLAGHHSFVAYGPCFIKSSGHMSHANSVGELRRMSSSESCYFGRRRGGCSGARPHLQRKVDGGVFGCGCTDGRRQASWNPFQQLAFQPRPFPRARGPGRGKIRIPVAASRVAMTGQRNRVRASCTRQKQNPKSCRQRVHIDGMDHASRRCCSDGSHERGLVKFGF